MHKKEDSVKEHSNYDRRRELDRIEGNRIIIHDHYPNRFMKLNEVVIITTTGTYTRKLCKAKTGKYMLQ